MRSFIFVFTLLSSIPLFAQVKWQSISPIQYFQTMSSSPLHITHANATYDASGAFIHFQCFTKDLEPIEKFSIKTKKIVVPKPSCGTKNSTLLWYEDGSNGKFALLDPQGNILKEIKGEGIDKVYTANALKNSYAIISYLKADKLKGIKVQFYDESLAKTSSAKILPEKGKSSFQFADSYSDGVRILYKDKKQSPKFRLTGISSDASKTFDVGIEDIDPLRITKFKVLEDGSTAIAYEVYKKVMAGKASPTSTIVYHISSDGSSKEQYEIDYSTLAITPHLDIVTEIEKQQKALQIFDFAIDNGKLIAWSQAYTYEEIKPATSSSTPAIAMSTSANYIALDAYFIEFGENIITKRISKPFAKFTVNNMTAPTNNQVIEVIDQQHANQFICTSNNEAVYLGMTHALDYVGYFSPKYEYENIAKRTYFGKPSGTHSLYTQVELKRENQLSKYLEVYRRGLLRMGEDVIVYNFEPSTNLLFLSNLSK